jgi:heme/copper-type cytochrome/quinol oxidase subunit 3
MAASIMASSFLLIYDYNLLALIGLLPTVVGLIAWQRDNWKPEAQNTTIDEEFEARFGIPVYTRLSHGVFRWATLLTGLTLGIILGTLVYSYLYLRLNFPQWPPEGVALPDLLMPAIGMLLLMGGAGLLWWAARALVRGDRHRLKGSLVLALLLSAAHIALLIFSYFQMGITPQMNAYGSIVFATLWFQVLAAAGTLLLGGISLYHTFLKDYHRDYQSMALNTILYWYVAAASGLVVFITLYVLPRVL